MKLCAVSFLDWLDALSPALLLQVLEQDDEMDTVDAWLEHHADITIWHPRSLVYRDACLTVLYDLQEDHWAKGSTLVGYPWMRDNA